MHTANIAILSGVGLLCFYKRFIYTLFKHEYAICVHS